MRGIFLSFRRERKNRRLAGGAERIRNPGVARSLAEGKPPRVLEKFRVEIR